MTALTTSDWQTEFGLDREKPTRLFSSVGDVEAAGSAAPQSYALRRAFNLLELDGILCQDNAPVIYFKEVANVRPEHVADLHRRFWNLGIAPILVLIAPNDVHVYSGFKRPDPIGTGLSSFGLVCQLNRVADELQSFVLSVESGEFFHRHAKSFDPQQRVDRNLLRDLRVTREKLSEVTTHPHRLAPEALDALLCRLIFTCYLFDRGVIDEGYLNSFGLTGSNHLRDMLRQQPRSKAKTSLYRLFEQLGRDFNGDLFSDDLEAECRQVTEKHLDVVDGFFRGVEVGTGQQRFWPYDFRVIPIETISAIYEHFLKAADTEAKKKSGVFYTPRFLAELVLDTTLSDVPSLIEKKFLDPACGSGIFLVGLFNRLADEWNRANPNAPYDHRASGLLKILRENLFGVDRNPTACHITAFSLCLAFLDQLSPPDIRELQRKGKMLPKLVRMPGALQTEGLTGTICCADFFSDEPAIPSRVHFVVGNPPWGSVTDKAAPVIRWCDTNKLPFPDKQIAAGFVWKAAQHVHEDGKVCFVLPHGTLFNHSHAAVEFQQEWLRRHGVEFVLNLADFQRFLFEESEAPALVVRYRHKPPANSGHRVEYWAPKTDWNVTKAELLKVLPQDGSRLSIREILDDLKADDAPLIWKARSWATSRDRRFLARLLLMPRLRDHVRQPRESDISKPWIIAEGFQPFGINDDPRTERTLCLPSQLFIPAKSKSIALFLLEPDCETLPSEQVRVRRQIRDTDIFRPPHVLVSEGFQKVAFADFAVSFHDPIRGIHGPEKDRDVLIFLAAFLDSSLAKYFQFLTSSNWGVAWQKVDVTDLLRLPFPLPEQTANPRQSEKLVRKVAELVADAAEKAKRDLVERDSLVRETQAAAEKLVEEYFDIDPIERMLIEDTNRIIIPSVRPTRKRLDVPTIKPSGVEQRERYSRLLCDTLNGFAQGGKFEVHARAQASLDLGVGLVVLEKTRRGEQPRRLTVADDDLLRTLRRLEGVAAKSRGSIQLVRGAKVFHENLLYVIKPIGQRFWTPTAALNDADEIASTILMQPTREPA